MLKIRKRENVLEVKKDGALVMVTFGIEAKTKDNLFIQAVRDEETNDFYYKWLQGSSYWEVELNNLKMRQLGAPQKRGDGSPPVYTIMGYAKYDADATNVNDMKVTVSDGVTYST